MTKAQGLAALVLTAALAGGFNHVMHRYSPNRSNSDSYPQAIIKAVKDPVTTTGGELLVYSGIFAAGGLLAGRYFFKKE